jgi:hypothetical protein
MAKVLEVTETEDLNRNLSRCHAMANITIALLKRGRVFKFPAVLINIFDRPQPPFEKRQKIESQQSDGKSELFELHIESSVNGRKYAGNRFQHCSIST